MVCALAVYEMVKIPVILRFIWWHIVHIYPAFFGIILLWSDPHSSFRYPFTCKAGHTLLYRLYLHCVNWVGWASSAESWRLIGRHDSQRCLFLLHTSHVIGWSVDYTVPPPNSWTRAIKAPMQGTATDACNRHDHNKGAAVVRAVWTAMCHLIKDW